MATTDDPITSQPPDELTPVGVEEVASEGLDVGAGVGRSRASHLWGVAGQYAFLVLLALVVGARHQRSAGPWRVAMTLPSVLSQRWGS